MLFFSSFPFVLMLQKVIGMITHTYNMSTNNKLVKHESIWGKEDKENYWINEIGFLIILWKGDTFMISIAGDM